MSVEDIRAGVEAAKRRYDDIPVVSVGMEMETLQSDVRSAVGMLAEALAVLRRSQERAAELGRIATTGKQTAMEAHTQLTSVIASSQSPLADRAIAASQGVVNASTNTYDHAGGIHEMVDAVTIIVQKAHEVGGTVSEAMHLLKHDAEATGQAIIAVDQAADEYIASL